MLLFKKMTAPVGLEPTSLKVSEFLKKLVLFWWFAAPFFSLLIFKSRIRNSQNEPFRKKNERIEAK